MTFRGPKTSSYSNTTRYVATRRPNNQACGFGSHFCRKLRFEGISQMAMEPSATPAMVVDARTVLRNVARLAEYAETHELDVRPHTKTHKSRQIADLQMAAGAIGLTAAKVGEAQLM